MIVVLLAKHSVAQNFTTPQSFHMDVLLGGNCSSCSKPCLWTFSYTNTSSTNTFVTFLEHSLQGSYGNEYSMWTFYIFYKYSFKYLKFIMNHMIIVVNCCSKWKVSMKHVVPSMMCLFLTSKKTFARPTKHRGGMLCPGVVRYLRLGKSYSVKQIGSRTKNHGWCG